MRRTRAFGQGAINTGTYTTIPRVYSTSQQGYAITFVNGTLTILPPAKQSEPISMMAGGGMNFSQRPAPTSVVVAGGMNLPEGVDEDSDE